MYCDYEKRLFEVLDRFLKFLGKYIDKKFRREKIKECDIHQVLELKSLRKDRGQIEEKRIRCRTCLVEIVFYSQYDMFWTIDVYFSSFKLKEN